MKQRRCTPKRQLFIELFESRHLHFTLTPRRFVAPQVPSSWTSFLVDPKLGRPFQAPAASRDPVLTPNFVVKIQSPNLNLNLNTTMKFLQIFALFFVAVSCAKVSKVSKIRKQSSNGLLQLKNSNFEDVLSGPRNYSLLLLLTATSSQVGCVLCNQFDPQYTVIAKSWVKEHPNDDGLYFGKADFTDSTRKIFNKFQLNSVPRLFYFPATNSTGSPSNAIGLDEYLFIEGDNVGGLCNFVEERTGNKINVVVPVNYSGIIFSVLTMAAFAALCVRFSSLILSIITSKRLWGMVVVLLILMFNAGYMFNKIRGSQYSGMSQNGPEYLMAGQQNQYAVETDIMSTVYGALAILTIALITKIPTVVDAKRNAIVVFVVVFMVFMIYSLLFDIFAKKSYGYPYRLLGLQHF